MKTKGFTLIELLVVIAIIGILSSVVLASLTTARTKGQDAAVQQQMSSMRSQAELYYSSQSPNTYGTAPTTAGSCTAGASANLFGGTNGLTTLLGGQLASQSKDCGTNGTAWSVAAVVPSGGSTATGNAFCVDSTGVSRSTNAAGTAYTGSTGGATPAHTTAGQTSCN